MKGTEVCMTAVLLEMFSEKTTTKYNHKTFSEVIISI